MDAPLPIDRDGPEGELLDRIKPELEPGERLIWAAWQERPYAEEFPTTATVSLSLGVVGLIFFLSGAGSLAKFFSVPGQARDTHGELFVLGVAGLCLGLTLIVITASERYSRFVSRGDAYRNFYAITDRRAIIWSPRHGSGAVEIHSYRRGTDGNLYRVEYPDGSGDVIFKSETSGFQFDGVSKVRLVEELVRKHFVETDVEAT